MRKSVFIRHRKSRNIHLVVWFEEGRERTLSFRTRSDAERERRRRILLLEESAARLDCFNALSDNQKRSLHSLHEHARSAGYDPWEAVRHYDSHLKKEGVTSLTVRQAVENCLQDKAIEGVSPRSLQSLRSVLRRFAGLHGDAAFAEVDHASISSFVDGLNVSLRTRMGYLTDLRTLYSWGTRKGFAGVNPVVAAMPGRAVRKKIMLAKRRRRRDQVLGVGDCRRLLDWVRGNDPSLLVYPVLCLFAGLRPEREAARIDWADVNSGHITVDARIAKDNETRIIEPLSANLVAWLDLIRSTTGNPLPLRNLRRRWDRAKQVLEGWHHDCMRHTYASHHFAMYRDAGLTAKNLGHPNPTLLRKDYNNAVTRAEAEEFWSIYP